MNKIEFNPKDTRKRLVYKSEAIKETIESKEQSKNQKDGQSKFSGKR